MNLDNLKKKQDEEFDENFVEKAESEGLRIHSGIRTVDLRSFIDKVRSETAEAVKKEIVICSGIKLADGKVLRCHRHGDGMRNAYENKWKLADGLDQQGFVTSRGRYVSREEGRKLQEAAGIKSVDREGYRGNTLFSEDLY